MQVSTKARYALRLLVDMAANSGEGNVKIKDISERQNISVKYLEQIITTLNKAGMVKGERGPQGGYRISIDPAKVTAGDVIRLVDGPSNPAPCVDLQGNPCVSSGRCATEEMWTRVGVAVDEILDSYTIAELAQRTLNIISLNPKKGLEYCI